MRRLLLALVLAGGLAALGISCSQPVPPPAPARAIGGTPARTVMTSEYVETVAHIAYIWGWPLVNNYHRALAMKKLPGPGLIGDVLPVSPPGYVAMLTDYIGEAQRFVTCPNQDTIDGAGYQWLDSMPVILQVPDFGDRYFNFQVVDARTDSVCEIGEPFGTKRGFYLLVGPSWKGATPRGMSGVCRSSTNLAAIFPRAFQDGTPEDKAAIQSVLGQFMVYPLSEFDGTMKTKDWAKIPHFPAPSGADGEPKWVVPELFFEQLPAVMKEIPPLPGEESLYATIRSVLDAAARDPGIAETLTRAAVRADKELIAPLVEFHNNGRPFGNGWTSPPEGGKWGFDYLSRAAAARSNMYANAPEVTRYLYADYDATGARLNGSAASAYTITFAKDQAPPIHGFWSLTVYDKQHMFAPNELHRYSVGTKSKSLEPDADGSLTLYVQHESPGKDRESNWLPAPDEEFSLCLRAYWPKPEILEGKWTPPEVRKIR